MFKNEKNKDLHYSINGFLSSADIQKAADEIKAHFTNKLLNKETGEWSNIELRYCDVTSDEALSYKVFSSMKQWRLDYISLAAVPQQTLVSS